MLRNVIFIRYHNKAPELALGARIARVGHVFARLKATPRILAASLALDGLSVRRGDSYSRWLARVKNHAGAPSRCHEGGGEYIIDPISNRDRYIRRNSQAIGERLSGALWKLPSSVCLTRGHVIGCFGVWYWSDRAESMFTRATDLHGRCRDGYSCRRVVDEYSRYSDTRVERCSSRRSFRVEREMPNAFRRTKPTMKPVIVARD